MALPALGKVGNTQHSAPHGGGQVHQRLQAAAHLGVFVAVAGHCGNHRVNNQQAHPSNALNRLLQSGQVLAWVKGVHAAIFGPGALDEVTAPTVSTGGQ